RRTAFFVDTPDQFPQRTQLAQNNRSHKILMISRHLGGLWNTRVPSEASGRRSSSRLPRTACRRPLANRAEPDGEGDRAASMACRGATSTEAGWQWGLAVRQ